MKILLLFLLTSCSLLKSYADSATKKSATAEVQFLVLVNQRKIETTIPVELKEKIAKIKAKATRAIGELSSKLAIKMADETKSKKFSKEKHAEDKKKVKENNKKINAIEQSAQKKIDKLIAKFGKHLPPRKLHTTISLHTKQTSSNNDAIQANNFLTISHLNPNRVNSHYYKFPANQKIKLYNKKNITKNTIPYIKLKKLEKNGKYICIIRPQNYQQGWKISPKIELIQINSKKLASTDILAINESKKNVYIALGNKTPTVIKPNITKPIVLKLPPKQKYENITGYIRDKNKKAKIIFRNIWINEEDRFFKLMIFSNISSNKLTPKIHVTVNPISKS